MVRGTWDGLLLAEHWAGAEVGKAEGRERRCLERETRGARHACLGSSAQTTQPGKDTPAGLVPEPQAPVGSNLEPQLLLAVLCVQKLAAF